MFDTEPSRTRMTKLAWGTALATLVIGQLHALARHRTEDGKSDLDLSTTSFWAEPAGRALDPLLSWAGPDTVYLAYGKWWIFALGVVAAAGYMVMRLRAPYGVEKWGWRIIAGRLRPARPRRRHLLLGAVDLLQRPRGHRALDGPARRAPVDRRGDGAGHRAAAPRCPAEAGRDPAAAGHPRCLRDSQFTSLGNADLPIMFAVAMLASAETRKVATERAGLSTQAVPATQ